MIRRLVLLLLICTLAVPVAGCGKKGDLEPPEGKKTDYPRQYPR